MPDASELSGDCLRLVLKLIIVIEHELAEAFQALWALDEVADFGDPSERLHKFQTEPWRKKLLLHDMHMCKQKT